MSRQFARASLGISEVLAELRSEFPEISVSKIRFLEAEGLIAPARSPSGYRRFGPADIDQLRFILTAQRDQYLPLRVIKERLANRAAPGHDRSRPGRGGPSRHRAGDRRARTPRRWPPIPIRNQRRKRVTWAAGVRRANGAVDRFACPSRCPGAAPRGVRWQGSAVWTAGEQRRREAQV